MPPIFAAHPRFYDQAARFIVPAACRPMTAEDRSSVGVAFDPATELARRLRDGELSSRDLLEQYLERIEIHNPSVNAVISVDAVGARRRAEQADVARSRGQLWGPLHGLPMTVKDAYATAGMRTTVGSRALARWVPDEDALIVRRLRDAGAIVFGKTNVPPLELDVQTYNPLFGTTNNPWDLARTPGGSSGGSAVAVAAGLSALELGRDIGGSIRIPAGYCGVYGHKPSYGIVPDPPHPLTMPGFRGEVDIVTAGPLARAAGDLELALQVLAGPGPGEARTWRLQLPPPRHAALAGYRIAAWLDDSDCPTEPEVLGPLTDVVAALREAGASVDEAAKPELRLADAFRTYQQLLYAAVCHVVPLRRLMRVVAPFVLGDGQVARSLRFTTQSHADWILADEARQQHRRQWAEFFADYDALLCPVTPVAAIAHDQRFGGALVLRTIKRGTRRRSYMDQFVWVGAVGVAYLPATVAPVGQTSECLPVGVQIVGAPYADLTTIDLARRLATVIGGYRPPPAYT